MPHIVILGTLDTKLHETLNLRSQIQHHSTRLALNPSTTITLIDCGRTATTHPHITIPHSSLLQTYSLPSDAAPSTLPRGEVIKLMTRYTTSCVLDLAKSQPIHGIVCAGGSGGTNIACSVMREALPIGVPKMMVSTVASGETGLLVGESDVSMMYSVVDIAGDNALLRGILGNAAGAIVGMASAYEERIRTEQLGSGPDEDGEKGNGEGQGDGKVEGKGKKKTRIGITMFGVTTPGVDAIRRHLESNYAVEIYVFHATGHGGRAMERLVATSSLDAILDLTTTEICDELMGGNMSAGGTRLEAALRRGLPTIISTGATDMVNFGARATVPEMYRDRKLFEHNPTVTLMRTAADECERVGRYVVEKIERWASWPEGVEVWLPMGGVSVISTPGAPFEDEVADAALRRAVLDGLKDTKVKVVEDPRAINDEGFAVDIAEAMMRKIEQSESESESAIRMKTSVTEQS